MSSKIRKIVTVQFIAEVDSDEWAEEYNLDPADLQAVRYDVNQWLRYGTDTAITEMPGSANTLVISDVEVQVGESADSRPEDSPTGRRIRVTWQTEETRVYDEVIAVPDTVSDDEIDEWIFDGNNPALVEIEEGATYDLPSFIRDTMQWERVQD